MKFVPYYTNKYYYSNALTIIHNIKKTESDIMDNELIEEIHIMKNHSEGTERINKHAVKKYTEFYGMSLKELWDEAEAEEDAGIKWKHRKLKRRLLTFRQYLLDNFSLNTVKAMFTHILVIYRYYEIELFELPQINKKNCKHICTYTI